MTRDPEDLSVARMMINEMAAKLETIRKADHYGHVMECLVYECTGLYQMTGEERFLEIARNVARNSENSSQVEAMWRRIWQVSDDEDDHGRWQAMIKTNPDPLPLILGHRPELDFNYLD